MKKIFQGSMIAGLALLGSVLPLQAQDRSATDQANNIPYGTRAGEFLLLPVGARATAMGSAFSAAANDISALFWNPGALATAGAKGAMVSHLDYVAETTHTWAGAAFPFAGGERSLGFQVGVFGFDDQPEYTVENPNGTGRSYSVSNSVLGVTYAQRFNDRFSFGLTGKYISEDLAGVKGTAFAADFGAHYAMMNLGGSDFGFALRGGWNYEPDNDLDVAASSSNGMNNDGLSAGGGMTYNIGEQSAIGLDYAYRDMGLLGARNMFSLGVRW